MVHIMVRKTSPSKLIKRLVPLAAAFTLLFLPGAAAQTANLDVTVPADEVEAMPGGSAAMNVTVAYSCGTTLPVTDIALTATIKGDAPGTAGVDPSTITPQSVADCEPGGTVTEMVELTYAPSTDQLADSKVEVDLTADYDPAGQGDGESVTKTATFVVGPYLDVSFAANTTTIDAAAGDEVPVGITVTSQSNTLVMAMPEVGGVPATWERPDVLPKNIPSPLEEGETGTATIDVLVKIPDDASGTVNLEVSLFAHSLTQTYAETETTVIPLTVNVAPGTATTADDDGDAEESPAFPVTALVLVGVALIALRRRQ